MRYVQLITPETYSFLAPLECNLVRVGGLGDGGYVIPEEDMFGIETLLSVGISDDWSFEHQIAKHSPRCAIYGYDRTSGSIVFVYSLVKEILSNHKIVTKVRMIKKWTLLTFSFAFFGLEDISFIETGLFEKRRITKRYQLQTPSAKFLYIKRLESKLTLKEMNMKLETM